MTDSLSDFEARVQRRAHELWEFEGRPEGRADEFWLRAELELRAAGESDSAGTPADELRNPVITDPLEPR